MSLVSRIRDAGRVLAGHRKYTYDINDLWSRGRYDGNVYVNEHNDAVASALESSAIAYACIDRMAKDAAGVPLVFLSDPEDYESDVGPSDPVASLFRKPAQGFTARRLVGWSVMMRQLRGEVFWVLVGGRRSPKMIAPWYDPLGWREIVSGDEGLVGWEYHRGDHDMRLAAGDVLWMGQDNPANPYRGLPPLRAAASALGIDTMGDTLQESMIKRGGERGLVLATEMMLDPEQYEQVVRNLAMRRPGAGLASRDFIVEGGMTLQNPDFTKEDIDILAWQNAAKDKICAVYGMAPVLIGDDDAAQYKSAPEAVSMYWRQTLVPLLKSFEDSWDAFFVERQNMRTYVRFDISGVPALQEDEGERAAVVKQYWDMGVPFQELNERYGLGFSDEAVMAADLPPLAPGPAKPEPAEDDDSGQEGGEKSAGRLTNKIIRQRAADSRFRIQRVRRLARLERSVWNNLKGLGVEYRGKTLEAIRAALDEHGASETGATAAAMAILELAGPFGRALEEGVAPAHQEAAEIGAASIQELVDGKMLEWHDRRKAISFAPETEVTMARRREWLREYSGPGWVQEAAAKVAEIIKEAGREGESVGTVANKVLGVARDLWNGWTSERAKTIARTEVGTLYNTSRYGEMGAQGFTKHEWVTSIDEATRDGINSEYDHLSADEEVRRLGEQFSTGLTHPQQSGGAAGNVINCRCETIPVIDGAPDYRDLPGPDEFQYIADEINSEARQ